MNKSKSVRPKNFVEPNKRRIVSMSLKAKANANTENQKKHLIQKNKGMTYADRYRNMRSSENVIVVRGEIPRLPTSHNEGYSRKCGLAKRKDATQSHQGRSPNDCLDEEFSGRYSLKRDSSGAKNQVFKRLKLI